MKKHWLALTVGGLVWSVSGVASAQAQDQTQTQAEAMPMAPRPGGAVPSPRAQHKPGEHAEEEHPGDHVHAPTNRNGNFVDYLWRASDEAFHAGDYEKAVKLHRSIELVDPSDVESYSVSAWLLWSLGRGGDAVKVLEQGIAANPQDPDMWDAAGQNFTLQKMTARSHEAYVKAVELCTPEQLNSPDGMMLRRRFAHATEKAGDMAGSAQVWRGLVADFPDDAVNKNNLARVERSLQEGQRTALNKDVVVVGGTLLATTGLALVGRRRRFSHGDIV